MPPPTVPLKRRRILIFTETFFPTQGGSERVAHNLAVALQENGYHVTVFAPSMEGDKEFDRTVPYRVLRDDRFGWFRRVDRNAKPAVSRISRIASSMWLSGKLLSQRYDAVIAIHLIPMAIPGLAMRLARRGPLFLWAHGEEIRTGVRSSAMRMQIKASIRHARGIFVNSSDTHGQFVDLGYPKRRMIMQHPVPDPIFFEPVTMSREVARDIHELDGVGNALVMVSFSRLVERKGLDTALRALGKVHRDAPDQNWVYLIGGTGEDKARLAAIAHEEGIRDRVQFLGARTEQEKRDLIEAADLFVMPNRELPNGETEGFGIVFVEAALRGTPCIGGRSGGTIDAIEQGVSGWLVKPDSPDELYTMLREKFAQRDALESMRPAVRAWAEEKFRPHLEHRAVLRVLRKVFP